MEELSEDDIRGYMAAHALGNPNICTGQAPEWQLAEWFGNRGGIRANEIAAAQAVSYTDALLSRLKATKKAA